MTGRANYDPEKQRSRRAKTMTRRTTDDSLAREAARFRHERNEARAALQIANEMLLGVYLRARLADPGDFEVYIGAAAVTDARGAIVWTRVDMLLDELLAAKPYLAAPGVALPWRRGTSALEWMMNQSV